MAGHLSALVPVLRQVPAPQRVPESDPELDSLPCSVEPEPVAGNTRGAPEPARCEHAASVREPALHSQALAERDSLEWPAVRCSQDPDQS